MPIVSPFMFMTFSLTITNHKTIIYVLWGRIIRESCLCPEHCTQHHFLNYCNYNLIIKRCLSLTTYNPRVPYALTDHIMPGPLENKRGKSGNFSQQHQLELKFDGRIYLDVKVIMPDLYVIWERMKFVGAIV